MGSHCGRFDSTECPDPYHISEVFTWHISCYHTTWYQRNLPLRPRGHSGIFSVIECQLIHTVSRFSEWHLHFGGQFIILHLWASILHQLHGIFFVTGWWLSHSTSMHLHRDIFMFYAKWLKIKGARDLIRVRTLVTVSCAFEHGNKWRCCIHYGDKDNHLFSTLPYLDVNAWKDKVYIFGLGGATTRDFHLVTKLH